MEKQRIAAELYQKRYVDLDLPDASTRLMLETVSLLDQAELEGWSDDELAEILRIDTGRVELVKQKYSHAKKMIAIQDKKVWLVKSLLNELAESHLVDISDRDELDHLLDRIVDRFSDLWYLCEFDNENIAEFLKNLPANISSIESSQFE